MPDRVEPSEAATALLPAGLLSPGERVRWMDRPSRWYLLLTGWKAYLASLLLTAALVYAQLRLSLATPVWVGALPAVAQLAASTLMLLSRVYVLTDRQAVMIAGVLTTRTVRVPLEQVQHTAVQRTIGEQLTGVGTVALASAGTGGAEIVWEMVREPYRVQEITDQARAALPRPSSDDGTADQP